MAAWLAVELKAVQEVEKGAATVAAGTVEELVALAAVEAEEGAGRKCPSS